MGYSQYLKLQIMSKVAHNSSVKIGEKYDFQITDIMICGIS